MAEVERRWPPKRKRLEPSPSPDEKRVRIEEFRDEIEGLVKYCKKLVSERKGELFENFVKFEKFEKSSASLNGVIASLMEESDLPLSKLVDEIFEKLKGRKGNGSGFSRASVKSAVLIIGQRLGYGVVGADADVLEDEDESALWYWETRDLKLLHKSARISLKVRRTCRKKIQERINAVLAMINALEKSENSPNCQHELMKASEKLSKVLNEAEIRLLLESMSHKNGGEIAEKELLIKQMEKNKREKERERKKIERQHQKEMLQNERELKRLHDEAEKEERRREKEEIELQKQLKRQQEEAEKDQRRKDKEEADSRKRVALQKQASLMERFLKRKNPSSSLQNDSSANKATTSGSSYNMVERNSKSVTLSMDGVLAQNDDGIEVEDIWKSHLNSWRSNRCSIRSIRKWHWGIRQKPKTELVKELKLTTNKEQACCEESNIEKLVVGFDDTNTHGRLPQTNMDSYLRPCGRKRVPVKLLQFDKSNRPAFYGVWPRKSQVVGLRHPFTKDSDIDYDIDSDEEWEEEEPGESLSDCDKDDEDEIMEEPLKDDEEDESEDGFFVPDGYLSEDEGVKADEIDNHDLDSKVQNQPTAELQTQNEEFCIMLRQQKYLNNLTEHALKRNQPFIILNLVHEKTVTSSAEELTGTPQLEKMALQALTIRPLPGFQNQNTDISVPSDVVDEDREISPTNARATQLSTAAAIDLPQIISVIQSCPNSISKIVKALHDEFPSVPKSQLRNKVQEISEFSDNRWQVKKEILRKHGFSTSPERGPKRMKSIATFLKKRCLPTSGTGSQTRAEHPHEIQHDCS